MVARHLSSYRIFSIILLFSSHFLHSFFTFVPRFSFAIFFYLPALVIISLLQYCSLPVFPPALVIFSTFISQSFFLSHSLKLYIFGSVLSPHPYFSLLMK